MDACSDYAASLTSASRPVDAPAFKPVDGQVHELALELAATTWTELDRESKRQGVPLERVIEHAAFVYLEAQGEAATAPRPSEEADEPESGLRSAGSA